MKTVSVAQNYSANSFQAYLPNDYGQKRDYPKIDLFLDGIYYGSTTWARSLETAIHALQAKTMCSVGTKIMAEYAAS